MSADSIPERRVACRYELVSRLGEGGLARVFRARDRLDGRTVTLKLLHSVSPERGEILRREAWTLCQLVHPNLCQVLDLGVAHELEQRPHYLTTQYAPGKALRPAVTLKQQKSALLGALHGLECLHQHGLLHGDFKADNIVVDDQGRETKLIDLSSARAIGSRAESFSGTMSHAAPELRGGICDERTDLFALGVCLRGLVQRPSAALTRLIGELTEREPVRRPANVADVLERLGWQLPERRSVAGLSQKLVGREQWTAAFEAWRQGDGGPSCFWLTGPAGIGKSRLLRELAWRASATATIVHGRVNHPSPILEMLRFAANDDSVHGLGGALEALNVLNAGPTPVLLVLDDADRLVETERRLWQALLAACAETPRVRLLCSSEADPGNGIDHAVVVRLGALSKADLRLWLPQGLSQVELDSVLRATAGNPGEVVALSRSLAFEDFAVGDLQHQAATQALSEAQRVTIDRFPESVRQTLRWLAANRGHFAHAEALQLGLSLSDLALLVDAGWLSRVEDGYRLTRPADAERLVEHFGTELLAVEHRRLLDHYQERFGNVSERRQRYRLFTRIVHHLCRLGRADEAAQWLVAHPGLADEASAELLEVIVTLSHVGTSTATKLTVSEFLAESGAVREALAEVARILRKRPPDAESVRARTVAGQCYLGMGSLQRARRQFDKAIELAHQDPRARAAALDGRALTLLRQGNASAALEAAQSTLDLEMSHELRLSLGCTMAMAFAYLARDADLAKLHPRLRAAAGIGSSRLRLRQQSALAFCAYRGGDPLAAAEHYRNAQSIVEASHLDDLAAVTTMNRGVAAHQLGEFAEAYAAYHRGLQIAQAQQLDNTQANLLTNLARLECDIGLFAQAERHADRALQLADALELDFLANTARATLGESALFLGRESAGPHLVQAANAFEAQGSRLESIEVRIQHVEVARLTGTANDPQELDEILKRAEALAADDTLASALWAVAGQALSEQRAAEAIELLERGLALAEATKRRLLVTRMHSRLAEAYIAAQSPRLAEHHRDLAASGWERLRLGLPASARDAFDAHPERAAAQQLREVAPQDGAPSGETAARQLRRFVEINRRLNSSLAPQQVLKETMEAAIELSGAERGFLILRDGVDGALKVPVARNIDRQRVERAKIKFSRDIAVSVIDSGEPALTVDAQVDHRFEQSQSVHALGLTSVLCVPIRTERSIVGAIYVDHRYRRGEFSGADLERMLAFADQVAIALENARLHDQLRERTEQLEIERDRVREILAGREDQIAQLEREIEQQRARPRRQTFGSVIGDSPAMQAVFERLERVVDTELNVLMWGESGTGKEVLARALHEESPKRAGPFVAVNCGAVPEALLEGELFGYTKGAFTGAVRDHPGYFQLASAGTLFLDEVGEMPASMQVKLLRALQEREVRPLGGAAVVPITARLLFATNRDLQVEVAEQRFREDLYYRIAVFDVRVPSLRERPQDLPALAAHVLANLAERLKRPPPKLHPAALSRLVRADWPGNVRQLENVLTRACLAAQGETIRESDLDLEASMPRQKLRGHELKRAMLAALSAQGWNVSEAARSLGIPRATFYRKLKKFSLRRQGRTNCDFPETPK